MFKRSLILFISSLLFSSCSIPKFNQASKGAISIAIQFPQKTFQVQLIKPETTTILAAVYGTELSISDPVLSPALTPDSPRVNLVVPLGNQVVIGAAYDGNRQILTAGKSTVNVNGRTQLELELVEDFNSQLTAEELAILNQLKEKVVQTPTPQASASFTPVVELQPSTPPEDSSNRSVAPSVPPEEPVVDNDPPASVPVPEISEPDPPVASEEPDNSGGTSELLPITPLFGDGSQNGGAGGLPNVPPSSGASVDIDLSTTDGIATVTDNSTTQGEDE